MPTGTGKSVVIAGLIEKARKLYGDVKFEVLTHVEELIEQNHKKMLEMSPLMQAGIYCAGLNRRQTGCPVTFASIGSVYRRPGELGWANVLLIDEAHLVNPKQAGMYRDYIAAKRSLNPNLRVFGYSATIFRMGLGLLTEGDLFSEVVYDITGYQAFNKLIVDGFLCPLVTLPTETRFDLSNVGVMNTGEYKQGELEHAMMDDDTLTYRALAELVHFGEEQKRKSWLIFASGVDHAKQVSDMLDARFDIQAPVITADTPKEERRAVIRDYRAGRIRCVVNNNVLTTGFDAPGVDLIGVLRATKSASLWVQMLGRGTRPVWAPGHDIHDHVDRLAAIAEGGKENCLVLDYTRNTETLGPVNDPVIPRKKGKGGPRIAPVAMCPFCNAYNHVLAAFCANCGQALPRAERELHLLDRSGFEVLKKDAEVQVEVFKVTRVTYSKGGKPGKPPYMLVVYYALGRQFKEFVLFEHTSAHAKNLARKWWVRRMRALHGPDAPIPDMPETVDEVLPFAHLFPVPTSVRVWLNKKPYPEVLSHEYARTESSDVSSSVGASPAGEVVPELYELQPGNGNVRAGQGQTTD